MPYNQLCIQSRSEPSMQEVDSLLPEYAGKSQSKGFGEGEAPRCWRSSGPAHKGLHKQPRNPQGGVAGTKFLTIVSPKNRAETNEHSPLMQ